MTQSPSTLNPAVQDTLARTIWAEARNQGKAGMEAVASVILNRAAHPRWWGGPDVRSVCLHPWQFSCWLPEPQGQLSLIRRVTIADPTFVLARTIAHAALTGALVDATHGADTYANLSVCDPAWAEGAHPCAVIGAHTFFRLELRAPVAPVLSAADRLNEAQLHQKP